MSSYADTTLPAHVRLTILRHLEASTEYTSNSSILMDVLARFGFRSSYDSVLGECTWLAEQGFVVLSGDADFLVVTATRRGVEIAQGRATHPGVQRPRPRL